MNTNASSTVRLRPPLALLGVEPMRAALEYASHLLSRRPAAAQGDGHRVIVFPGLGADRRSVTPLRNHLRALGYDANDWGRGFNRGPRGDSVDTWLEGLAAEVLPVVPEDELPVTLIGWSLGGIYAREVAKIVPARVRQVITIGTPFNSDGDHSNVGWLFKALSGSPASISPALSRRLRTPPPVPTTSILSRSDGIVAWQTCRHVRAGPQVEDIEVHSSHVGMGWNPRVLRIVADRLAQPLGAWQPYKQRT